MVGRYPPLTDLEKFFNPVCKILILVSSWWRGEQAAKVTQEGEYFRNPNQCLNSSRKLVESLSENVEDDNSEIQINV